MSRYITVALILQDILFYSDRTNLLHKFTGCWTIYQYFHYLLYIFRMVFFSSETINYYWFVNKNVLRPIIAIYLITFSRLILYHSFRIGIVSMYILTNLICILYFEILICINMQKLWILFYKVLKILIWVLKNNEKFISFLNYLSIVN